MTNSTADRLVDDYLTRLAQAAQALPPDRRTELLSEIREHIDSAITGVEGADESATRMMLDRLGGPDDIVAAALEIDPPEHREHPQSSQRRQQGIGLEVGAVVMLTAGSLIPIVGWVIGVILLWSSGLWRRSEKILGTLIFPGGLGGILLWGGAFAALASSQTCGSSARAAIQVSGPNQAGLSGASGPAVTPTEICTGFAPPSWLPILILLVVVTAPMVVAIVLLNRARGRAALAVR